MLQIETFVFNPFSENTYVIHDEQKRAWLIDPGNSSLSETEKLSNFITENGLTIERILLTHAHIDHIFGLQWAYDQFKVPVYLKQEAEEVLKLGQESAVLWNLDYEPFHGELMFLNEGDDLKLGSEDFEIYFTPGHSPGSVSYHNQSNKILFSGDVLFENSIGRTDLYKGDYDQLIKSIKTQLLVLDDDTMVYSGHGRPTKIGIEKKTNPFLK